MHHWQDFVLSLCILCFNIALLPTLLSRHKPHVTTGIITAAFQIVAFSVYATLHLWYTGSMCLVNSLLWTIIVIQKLEMDKRPKRRKTRAR